LGPILFLIYINDLPNLASTGTKILLYADDTSIKVTSPNVENFETKIDNIFGVINNWFKANKLILNYNKTNYLQFNTKNSWDYEVKPNYQGNYINSSSNTKFLGLTIDDSLSWKAHIDQMMSKLNTTCFVIRMIQDIMSLETLKMVYFAYIHSIISSSSSFSSTTLCEFWLVHLFLSIAYSPASFFSNWSPPSASNHSSHRLPILLLALPSVLLHTFSICIWSWPLFR